jgi:ethanolamine utilization protein EutP (predicted NTPase)
MQKHNYSGLNTLETDLKASISALETCQDKLSGGFVNNVNNPLVGVAQKTLQALDDDLNNAADWLSKQ